MTAADCGEESPARLGCGGGSGHSGPVPVVQSSPPIAPPLLSSLFPPTCPAPAPALLPCCLQRCGGVLFPWRERTDLIGLVALHCPALHCTTRTNGQLRITDGNATRPVAHRHDRSQYQSATTEHRENNKGGRNEQQEERAGTTVQGSATISAVAAAMADIRMRSTQPFVIAALSVPSSTPTSIALNQFVQTFCIASLQHLPVARDTSTTHRLTTTITAAASMSSGSEAPVGVSKKKQQQEREGMQPVRVPNSTATANSPATCAALFPKLQLGALNQPVASSSGGGGGGGSSGASPNSALSAGSHPHELPKLPPACAHESLFPKLHSRAGAAAAGAGGKGGASAVDSADSSRAHGHAPIPSTRRARHSNADEHANHAAASVAAASAPGQPAPSLPSISPRVDTAAAVSASLVDRIAAGIGAAAKALPNEQQVTSRREQSSRKEKEMMKESKEGASTKRKQKTKSKPDQADGTKAARKKEGKKKGKKRRQDQPVNAAADPDAGASFASVALGSVQRLEGIVVAASDDEAQAESDDQYSSDDDAAGDDDPDKEDAYDDEQYSDEYSSSEAEATPAQPQPSGPSVTAAVPSAVAAAAAPAGPAPAHTEAGAAADTEVGEQGGLDESIDEEGSCALPTVAPAQPAAVATAATATVATATAAAANSEEESVAGLLESPHATQTLQHPTSLQSSSGASAKKGPTAPAPYAGTKAAATAKSSNKKPSAAVAAPSKAAARTRSARARSWATVRGTGGETR